MKNNFNSKKSRVTARHLIARSLMFSVYTADDIKKLSVTKIRTPLSFNVLGHPLKGGLYDPALGPLLEKSDPCATCGFNVFKCPGHFGHIELPVPVVNPLFHKSLFSLLKFACLKCYSIQIPAYAKLLIAAKSRLLKEGLLTDLVDLEQEVMLFLSNYQRIEDADSEDIKNVIESYIKNALKKKKYCDQTKQLNQSDLNTKNINMQWREYIETVMKSFTANKVCSQCQSAIPKITAIKNKIMVVKPTDSPSSENRVYKLETRIIMPNKSREHLRELWHRDAEFMKVLFPCLSLVETEYPTDVFFFEVIPVLPPIVRPVNYLKGQMIEHPQTQIYKSIIQDCLVLRNVIQTIQDGNTDKLPDEGKLVFERIRGNNATEKLHNAWQTLQANVDHLLDRELSKTSESNMCLGLKQIIEKKDGILRMHTMGKRVNYSCRTVITPDPNIGINEIGIPEAFALKLTYPTPVSPFNVVMLRNLILNGPNVHPGAVMVENEEGSITHLKSEQQRQAMAKTLLATSDKSNSFFNGIKIVHRHLQNGDIVLLNRQPTLHKPSIMAHKVRILKGEKTIRLHYANCKSYNADYDGDEMNCHFPQNELARSEGYNIANVTNQYLVPKDGTPLSGLIQDHVVSGVRLTMRGQFFDKVDYMQLVYCGLATIKENIILLPPCILKPKILWSGKQVISTIIINLIPQDKAKINLMATSKISAQEWQTSKPKPWKYEKEFTDSKLMSEAEVVIRNGELLCGVLDKNHYGATPYSLIHCIFELYGGECALKMLSAFGKLFQSFLQRDGFTLGIDDILILPKADKNRQKIISKCREVGERVQRSMFEDSDDVPMSEIRSKIEESYFIDPKFRTRLDRKYKAALDVYTNDINSACLPSGLLRKFPDNNLQLMVQSGAKGSRVNTMQISCLLGQIELEGKRPPLMINGKSLPSFPPFDPSPRAGGFIDGRFMTGIQPQEFFFHCMAGREGLIDTAVKTSRSGYLQRCLVKHLEGLTVNYDSTVRDSDGSLIQFYYGEDGLDIPRSRFLLKEQLDFLINNKDAILQQDIINYLKENSDYKSITKLNKKIKKWKNKNDGVRRINSFTKFSAENYDPNNPKNAIINENSGRSKSALSLMRKWLRQDDEVKQSYDEQCSRCPDPVNMQYRQDVDFGVLSEKMDSLIDEYLDKRSSCKPIGISKNDLRDLLCLKTMNSVCQPGEPVGLLAAQSIGEPSTQMTLNTFHFAGRGEMNVTLGIPRLREILMMASKNIKTPSMEIPFRSDLKNVSKQSKRLRRKLNRCLLSDVLKNIHVDRKMVHRSERQLLYTFTIDFLRYASYKSEFAIKPQEILKKTEDSFFKELFKEIKKMGKISGSFLRFEEEKRNIQAEDSMLDDGEPEITETKKTRSDLGEMHESSDEEEMADDADATASRSISRHQENKEYDDPEDEELDALNENENEDDIPTENDTNNAETLDESDEDDYVNSINRTLDEKRKRDVVNMYPSVIEYDFDNEKYLWAKLQFLLPLKTINLDFTKIIRKVAEKIILWEIPDIKKGFTFQNKEGETVLKTDGLNIVEMFKYIDILDLNRLYSNDIYGISQTYGIEAANRVIIKEVKEVFKMYGITVDVRHLSLIADYMTFDGTFQPLSRKGMEGSASPLQQMSFESSLNALRNATLQGKTDNLTSPSSRIMLGQPCKSGTGICSLLAKIQKPMTSTVNF